MKKVRKALIPCAGYGTRFLPWTKALPKEMLPLVDKPVLEYILEEARESGISEVLLITSRGKFAIEDYFDMDLELEKILEEKGKKDILKKVRHTSEICKVFTVRQAEALGLGHAVSLGEAFMGDEPFAVMLPDNPVYNEEKPALKQLIEEFEKRNSSIVGVNEVKMEETEKYGIIAGNEVEPTLWEVRDLVEKPESDKAPSNLAMLGRYVFTPKIFYHLSQLKPGKGGELQLTDAIKTLLNDEKVYAKIYNGVTYDTGNPEGYLRALNDYYKYSGRG